MMKTYFGCLISDLIDLVRNDDRMTIGGCAVDALNCEDIS